MFYLYKITFFLKKVSIFIVPIKKTALLLKQKIKIKKAEEYITIFNYLVQSKKIYI